MYYEVLQNIIRDFFQTLNLIKGCECRSLFMGEKENQSQTQLNFPVEPSSRTYSAAKRRSIEEKETGFLV